MMQRFVFSSNRYFYRLLVLGLLSFMGVAWADDDEKATTNTVTIEQGKLVGEHEEIEIYDYHTGTYQSVYVYRKPREPQKPSESLPAPVEPASNPPAATR
jgi:hypothetical protein